jgi:hypothetical protein
VLGSVKNVAKVTLILVGLAVLSWAGTFLYWHFRIKHAIRTIELSPRTLLGAMGTNVHEAYFFLMEAGCRSMPYAFRAIEASQDPIFVRAMTGVIESPLRSRTDDVDAAAELAFLARWEDDPSELHPVKRERLRTWWNEKGEKYHRWWRVWSSNCRAAR